MNSSMRFPSIEFGVVQGEPREIFVVQREGRWVEVIGDLTDPRIPDYLEVAFGDLTEGSVYEVNLEDAGSFEPGAGSPGARPFW